MLIKRVSLYWIKELARKITVMNANFERGVGNNPPTSSNGILGFVILAERQRQEGWLLYSSIAGKNGLIIFN
jgi:hypothetical protein